MARPFRTNISDLSALSGLTNLRSLNLFLTNISDLSALSGLTNLTELDLSGTNISDISALSGLTNLTWLDLSVTNISDLSALSGLTNLTELDLFLTNISDLSALAGLTDLERLYLSETNISDISALSGLTNLTELALSETPLSFSSINDHIPALQGRGITVLFDPTPLREREFNIELVFLTDQFNEARKNVLRFAARRWMSVITEDLPDYTFTQGWSGQCGDHSYAIPSGERIDDLRIYVTSIPRDDYTSVGGVGHIFCARRPICLSWDAWRSACATPFRSIVRASRDRARCGVRRAGLGTDRLPSEPVSGRPECRHALQRPAGDCRI